MSLEGAARFRAFLREHDLNLDEAARVGDPSVIAVDRAGGVLRIVRADEGRAPGVWWESSEGTRAWVAASTRALFVALGRGFTVADQIAGRPTPSGRPAPGLLAWAEELPEE